MESLGKEQTNHARVAALSIAHGAALAKLLRAHGRGDHAANVEAALSAFMKIVSDEVGYPLLAEAMNLVSDETAGPAHMQAVGTA